MRHRSSLCLLPWLLAAVAAPALAQRLAYDECDGIHRGGFAGDGYGSWQARAIQSADFIAVTAGNDWRLLQQPITGGVVWYVVTLRVQQPLDGYASVVPAADTRTQCSELGGNSGYHTPQGLWTAGRDVVPTGRDLTELQTFVQRYDLDRGTWSAWSGAGLGQALLDDHGRIASTPRIADCKLTASRLAALYLTKGSAQVLEIHRVALARTALEALTPVADAQAVAAEAVGAAAAAPAIAIDDANVHAFAERARLPEGGAVSFFGDSITWQGGHVHRLRAALAAARPGLHVSLHQRGLNGGSSTDLLAGAQNLYGTSQAPFAEVLATDRPTAAVIQIGINDVWHQDQGKGTEPAAFAAALRTMLSAAHAARVPILLCTPTLIGELPSGANAHDPKLDEYAAIVRTVAAEGGAGVRLCDLRAAFTAFAQRHNRDRLPQGLLTTDGVHLTDTGNAMLADQIAAGLLALLGESDLPPVELPLVPWPRHVQRRDGSLRLPPQCAVARGDAALAEHAEVFASELNALTGAAMVASDGAAAATIELQVDRTLATEAYELRIDQRATVRGGSADAVAYGTATLLQLLERGDQGWQWPQLTLADEPTCSYRGLLVDVARQPHPLAVLKTMVVLCRIYKVRYLQLHLTDDQAFTFPSTAFPTLATKNHSYTLAELQQLEAFARARGVTIVPEFDVPGHCGALITAMPQLFRAHGKHHATIAFVRPEVLDAVDTILGEMLAVFPRAPFCHLGGDECDLEHVLENPAFASALREQGLASAQDLYRHFLCQLRDRVRARGKQLMVWEGFGPEGKVAIPTDVIVMAFESLYHTPDKLVASGYPVVNASWQPLYVVGDRCWSEREIYAWNRGHFQHFVEGYPAFHGLDVPADKVLGAQLCAWEQPAALELPSLRRRLAALAERTWNERAGRSQTDFAARLRHTDARLDALLGESR